MFWKISSSQSLESDELSKSILLESSWSMEEESNEIVNNYIYLIKHEKEAKVYINTLNTVSYSRFSYLTYCKTRKIWNIIIKWQGKKIIEHLLRFHDWNFFKSYHLTTLNNRYHYEEKYKSISQYIILNNKS